MIGLSLGLNAPRSGGGIPADPLAAPSNGQWSPGYVSSGIHADKVAVAPAGLVPVSGHRLAVRHASTSGSAVFVTAGDTLSTTVNDDLLATAGTGNVQASVEVNGVPRSNVWVSGSTTLAAGATRYYQLAWVRISDGEVISATAVREFTRAVVVTAPTVVGSATGALAAQAGLGEYEFDLADQFSGAETYSTSGPLVEAQADGGLLRFDADLQDRETPIVQTITASNSAGSVSITRTVTVAEWHPSTIGPRLALEGRPAPEVLWLDPSDATKQFTDTGATTAITLDGTDKSVQAIVAAVANSDAAGTPFQGKDDSFANGTWTLKDDGSGLYYWQTNSRSMRHNPAASDPDAITIGPKFTLISAVNEAGAASPKYVAMVQQANPSTNVQWGLLLDNTGGVLTPRVRLETSSGVYENFDAADNFGTGEWGLFAVSVGPAYTEEWDGTSTADALRITMDVGGVVTEHTLSGEFVSLTAEETTTRGGLNIGAQQNAGNVQNHATFMGPVIFVPGEDLPDYMRAEAFNWIRRVTIGFTPRVEFTVSPTLTPESGSTGTTFTLTDGTAIAEVSPTTTRLLYENGTDVTSSIVSNEYDATAARGQIAAAWTASNSTILNAVHIEKADIGVPAQTGTASTWATTRAAENGVIFTFDASRTVGRFAGWRGSGQGDLFVVGSTDVTITPGGDDFNGAIYGAMKNLQSRNNKRFGFRAAQSFEYDAALDVNATGGSFSMEPGDIVVFALPNLDWSGSKSNGAIQRFITLSCVSAAPDHDQLRPAVVWQASDKANRPTVKLSDIDWTVLPNLDSTGITAPSDIDALCVDQGYNQPAIDCKNGTSYNPFQTADPGKRVYGRDMIARMANAYGVIMSDMPLADRQKVATGFIQHALDTFGAAVSADAQGFKLWKQDGGHNGGRYLHLVAAGQILAGSSDATTAALGASMKGSRSLFDVQEEDQIFLVEQSDVDQTTEANRRTEANPTGTWNPYFSNKGFAPLTSGMIGMPQWVGKDFQRIWTSQALPSLINYNLVHYTTIGIYAPQMPALTCVLALGAGSSILPKTQQYIARAAFLRGFMEGSADLPNALWSRDDPWRFKAGSTALYAKAAGDDYGAVPRLDWSGYGAQLAEKHFIDHFAFPWQIDVDVIEDDAGLTVEYTLGSDQTTLTVNVTAPAGLAGTYNVTLADLAAGPVNIIPPTVTGTVGVGNDFAASSGVWVYDTDFAAPVISRQWVRADGSPITGETGTTYTQTSDDPPLGVSIRETATSTLGARSVTVEAVAPAALSAVRFPTGSRLRLASTGIAPIDYNRNRKMTWIVRMESDSTAGNTTFFGKLFRSGLKIRDATRYDIEQRANDGTTQPIGGGTPITHGGDPITVMVSGDFDGGLAGGKTLSVWCNGSEVASTTLTDPAWEWDLPLNDTQALLGDKIEALGTSAESRAYGFVWLAAGAFLDPATHWSTFVNPDNTLKTLAAADGTVSGVTPVLYLPMANMLTGTNAGSGVDVAVEGTPEAVFA